MGDGASNVGLVPSGGAGRDSGFHGGQSVRPEERNMGWGVSAMSGPAAIDSRPSAGLLQQTPQQQAPQPGPSSLGVGGFNGTGLLDRMRKLDVAAAEPTPPPPKPEPNRTPKEVEAPLVEKESKETSQSILYSVTRDQLPKPKPESVVAAERAKPQPKPKAPQGGSGWEKMSRKKKTKKPQLETRTPEKKYTETVEPDTPSASDPWMQEPPKSFSTSSPMHLPQPEPELLPKPPRVPVTTAPNSWGTKKKKAAAPAKKKASTFEQIQAEEARVARKKAVLRQKQHEAYAVQQSQMTLASRLAQQQMGGSAWGKVSRPIRAPKSISEIQSEQINDAPPPRQTLSSRVATGPTTVRAPAVSLPQKHSQAQAEGSPWGSKSPQQKPSLRDMLLAKPKQAPMAAQTSRVVPVTIAPKPVEVRKPAPQQSPKRAPKPTASPKADKKSEGMFWELDDSAGGGAPSPAKPAFPAATNLKKSGKSGKGNVFGGPTMSKEFKRWCEAKLQKLSGSADTTLVEYLMTIKNEADIREHIQLYLGNGLEVKEFADGFLQQKDFSRAKTKKVERKNGVPALVKPSPSIASAGSFGVLGAMQPAGGKKRNRRRKKKR